MGTSLYDLSVPTLLQTARAVGGSYQLLDQGITRVYRLFVPAGHDPTKPMPLVVLFHGWGGDENEFLDDPTVSAPADVRGWSAPGTGWPRALDCRAPMGHDYGLGWSWKLILDFFEAQGGSSFSFITPDWRMLVAIKTSIPLPLLKSSSMIAGMMRKAIAGTKPRRRPANMVRMLTPRRKVRRVG